MSSVPSLLPSFPPHPSIPLLSCFHQFGSSCSPLPASHHPYTCPCCGKQPRSFPWCLQPGAFLPVLCTLWTPWVKAELFAGKHNLAGIKSSSQTPPGLVKAAFKSQHHGIWGQQSPWGRAGRSPAVKGTCGGWVVEINKSIKPTAGSKALRSVNVEVCPNTALTRED